MLQLDAHGQELLNSFRELLPKLQRLEQLVFQHINDALRHQGIYVTAVEHRVKAEDSLAGKLELKGSKYKSIDDITDLLGVRIITFYTDDVEKVAALVKKLFDVDWSNSVDKRKQHQLDSFGYNSLHYICRLKAEMLSPEDDPVLCAIRFEIQMRTALEHVWSTIEHDIGYKGVVTLPSEYMRQFSRLAGMLELADDEFSRLRATLNDYRRQVQSLVATGKLDQVILSVETFRSYLELSPFKRLNQRIAAVNQAEIIDAPMMPYLRIFQKMGFVSLGDVEQMIIKDSDDALQLALSQFALTDLDIIAESAAPMYLCIVHILKAGQGKQGLVRMFDFLNGYQAGNTSLAVHYYELAAGLPFMQLESEKGKE